MGKSKSKKEQKRLGSTIKYLSFAPNTEVARAVIAGADDKVVRAIANAALNAQQNPAVRLSPADRDLFRRNSPQLRLSRESEALGQTEAKAHSPKGWGSTAGYPDLGICARISGKRFHIASLRW